MGLLQLWGLPMNGPTVLKGSPPRKGSNTFILNGHAETSVEQDRNKLTGVGFTAEAANPKQLTDFCSLPEFQLEIEMIGL